MKKTEVAGLEHGFKLLGFIYLFFSFARNDIVWAKQNEKKGQSSSSFVWQWENRQKQGCLGQLNTAVSVWPTIAERLAGA